MPRSNSRNASKNAPDKAVRYFQEVKLQIRNYALSLPTEIQSCCRDESDEYWNLGEDASAQTALWYGYAVCCLACTTEGLTSLQQRTLSESANSPVLGAASSLLSGIVKLIPKAQLLFSAPGRETFRKAEETIPKLKTCIAILEQLIEKVAERKPIPDALIDAVKSKTGIRLRANFPYEEEVREHFDTSDAGEKDHLVSRIRSAFLQDDGEFCPDLYLTATELSLVLGYCADRVRELRNNSKTADFPGVVLVGDKKCHRVTEVLAWASADKRRLQTIQASIKACLNDSDFPKGWQILQAVRPVLTGS